MIQFFHFFVFFSIFLPKFSPICLNVQYHYISPFISNITINCTLISNFHEVIFHNVTINNKSTTLHDDRYVLMEIRKKGNLLQIYQIQYIQLFNNHSIQSCQLHKINFKHVNNNSPLKIKLLFNANKILHQIPVMNIIEQKAKIKPKIHLEFHSMFDLKIQSSSNNLISSMIIYLNKGIYFDTINEQFYGISFQSQFVPFNFQKYYNSQYFFDKFNQKFYNFPLFPTLDVFQPKIQLSLHIRNCQTINQKIKLKRFVNSKIVCGKNISQELPFNLLLYYNYIDNYCTTLIFDFSKSISQLELHYSSFQIITIMDYMKISKRFSFVIKIINFNSMKQIGKIIEKEFKYLSENGLKISNHFSPYYQIYQLLPLSLYGQKTVEFSIDCSKKNIIMISQFQGIIYSLNASSFYQKLHCSLLANFSNNLHVRSEPIILIFTKTIEEKCQENEIIIEKKNHQSCERSDVHECNMTCAYSGSKTNRCQWKNYSDTSFLNKKIQCSHDHEVCPDEICDEVEWEYWRMNKQVLCDNDCRQFVYRRKDENVTISSSFNVNQKSDDYYFILISIPMLIILITLIYYVLRSVNHPNKMKKFESDKNNGNYRYWISFQKLHVNGSLSSGHFANVISGKLSLTKSHSIDVAIKVGKKFGCNSGISDILNEYNIFEILQNEENGGRENVCRMIGISTDEHDGIYLVMEFAKLGNLTEYLQTIASTVNFGVRFQKMRMNDDLLISTINSSTLSFEDGCYIYSIEFENVVRGICNRNKKLNCLEKFLVFKQLSDYCQQVTNGLKFLHSHKIIHSDIAARNILVFSKDLVKIGDFGMAVNGKNPELKKNREIPLFWSSLNILENETPKYEDDIWSLGVVFWEIFHLCVAQPYSLTEINKKKFTVLLDPNEMNYLFINESMNFKNNFIKYLKNGYRLPPPGMLLQSYRELKSESINSSEQNLSKSSKSTNGDEDLIDTSVSSTHSYENVMELRHKTKNPYQSDDQIRMEENKSKSGYYHPSILNRFCSKNSYCQSISENCSFIKPNKFSRVSCKKNSLLFTSEITERLFNLMLNCWNGQESFSLDEIWMEINKINQGISKVASEELNIFHNGTYNAMKSNCLYESKCKRIH